MDIVLDANYLVDFLAQYFDRDYADRGQGRFYPEGCISSELARRLNGIIVAAQVGMSSLVISSTLAFVEIGRNWNTMVRDRFVPSQLHAFLLQPPAWFDIAPIDDDLLPSFINIPPYVFLRSRSEPIEWTDAVHLATMFSREENTVLATSDSRIRAILNEQGRVYF